MALLAIHVFRFSRMAAVGNCARRIRLGLTAAMWMAAMR